jgi:hypothetical protein
MERLCGDARDRGTTLAQAIDDAARTDASFAAALPADARALLFEARHLSGDADAMIDRTLRDWAAT